MRTKVSDGDRRKLQEEVMAFQVVYGNALVYYSYNCRLRRAIQCSQLWKLLA